MSQIHKLKELKALKGQIKQHAKAAFELLPETLVLPFEHNPAINRSIIERMHQNENWTLVLNLITSFGWKNDYSPALLSELSLAHEALALQGFIEADEQMARTSQFDKQIIGEGIRALANGPFVANMERKVDKLCMEMDGVAYTDGEEQRDEFAFGGLSIEVLKPVGASWPDIKDARLACRVASEAIDFIDAYPYDRDHEWQKYFSVSREQANAVADRWRILNKKILNS